MTDKIELPPLPEPEVGQTESGLAIYNAFQMDAYARAAILADRARQAPAPVEVSRLAKALQLVRDLRRHLTDGETLKVSVTLDELDSTIDRLASMASTPVGEVPAGWKLMPQDLTDEMVIAACKAGCWRVTEYSVKDVRAAYAAMLAVAEPAHIAKEAQGTAAVKSYQGGISAIRWLTSPRDDVSPVLQYGLRPINGGALDWFDVPTDVAASPAPAASKGAETMFGECSFCKSAIRGVHTQACRDRAAPSEPEAQKAVAWQHIMYGEGQRLNARLTFTAANPFGESGKDYSDEYTVESTPLFPAASMEVQGLPEPDWLAVDTPGADFDVSFALTMEEALQLNDGDPDAPTYITKLYSEEKVRALAAKNGWRLGEGRG